MNLKPMFTDADVRQLMEIGYTKDISIYALDACHGDMDIACDMLLEFGLVGLLHHHK